MTDNDIIRFALMPRFSQQQADYVLGMEAIQPVVESCTELNQLLDKVSVLTQAQSKLLKHGATNFVIEEFGEVLSSYHINFDTQSISACIEGLSGVIEQIWTSIKNTLSRLLSYLSDHPIFTMWFNRCDFYRARMADIIANSLRDWVKADIDTFNGVVVTGWKPLDFKNRVFHTGNLITKIKNYSSSRMELIDIQQMFGQEIDALGYRYENDSVVYVPMNYSYNTDLPAGAMRKGTTKDLGWKPYDVYQIASTLYGKVAANSMYLNRTGLAMSNNLKIAIVESNNVLTGREDGTNEEKIMLAKKRIKNIRNFLTLIQIATNNTFNLCAQWYKMASSFDTNKRAYPKD